MSPGRAVGIGFDFTGDTGRDGAVRRQAAQVDPEDIRQVPELRGVRQHVPETRADDRHDGEVDRGPIQDRGRDAEPRSIPVADHHADRDRDGEEHTVPPDGKRTKMHDDRIHGRQTVYHHGEGLNKRAAGAVHTARLRRTDHGTKDAGQDG